jgi:hypothetical protein
MKVQTLVACTFFISTGKWKGHYNDGRSNKDNSVVNWKLEQMQQTMCAKPIQRAALLVSMENLLQPQVKHDTTCLAVKKPNESTKFDLSTSTVTFGSLSLSPSFSPNEVRKFD